MSQQLINRSPDLKKLRDAGYDMVVRGGVLVVRDIPYVDSSRQVRRGVLVSELNLAGDETAPPTTHVVYFAGDHPCRIDGTEISTIKHGSGRREFSQELVTNHSFSNKPPGGYPNYFDLITRYIEIISAPAVSLDSQATARTYPVVAPDEDDQSPFKYFDTATSRAQIEAANRKLAVTSVAIVGVGGTGAYILDLVAKTPVGEIHLFDGDSYFQHNAFRTPGAPSVEDLGKRPNKAEYFAGVYSNMRKGIVPHPYFVGSSNVHELQARSFVFISMDRGGAKRDIMASLQERSIPFVDVGMGLEMVDSCIGGILRVTLSSDAKHDHVARRVPFGEPVDDDYARNIQVADLNALNASLAVIRWKKLLGFYRDFEREHHATYTLDTAMLHNEDTP